MTHPAAEPLLEVHGLTVAFMGGSTPRPIVTGIDFQVARGETIAIVGESGSGKSLSARAVMRLLPRGLEAEGTVRFDGREVLSLSEREMSHVRGRQMSMILQDPFTMLNPVMRCGDQIVEALRGEDNRRLSRKARATEAARRLVEVGITDPTAVHRYPFQLSGGMRQRVALAAALAANPQLLIADEPSTALDVTTQAEILALLKSLQEQRGMGLILITHDLRVAFSVAQRIYVLYAGSLVEVADARDLEHEPCHPYSLGLLLAEPAVEKRQAKLIAIEGAVPAPDEVADRCSFQPRCRWAAAPCGAGKPPLRLVDGGDRATACVRFEEIRPGMQAVRQEGSVAAAALVLDPRQRETLLTVRDLRKSFVGRMGQDVHALQGVSIEVGANESVGLVGESGSGKSTLGRCIVGLEVPTSGLIELDGLDATDFQRLSRADRRLCRRTVQIVFQDPYSSLDPTQTVGSAIREVLHIHARSRNTDGRVAELLELVGLPTGYARRRPASLSGGERQRVAIARALAVEPKLLVCDEPVSALDVSVQAQVLNLFRQLREEFGLSYLFITHDLGVVRQVVDRVYVLHNGLIVEQGPVDEVLDAPKHEYTTRLIESIPRSAA